MSVGGDSIWQEGHGKARALEPERLKMHGIFLAGHEVSTCGHW